MDNRKRAIASRILTAITAGAFPEVLRSILPDDVCSERRIRRHFESGILCSRKPTYFITRKNRKNMASLGRGRLHLPEVRLRRGYRRQKGPGRDGSPAQVGRHADRNANAGRRHRGCSRGIPTAPVGQWCERSQPAWACTPQSYLNDRCAVQGLLSECTTYKTLQTAPRPRSFGSTYALTG